MAVFTGSKNAMGSAYPTHAVDGLDVTRAEPLITPEQLKRRFLLGVPLVSNQKDPITGRRVEFTPDDLQEQIKLALNQFEFDTGVYVLPQQFQEKLPFDRAAYVQYGYLKVGKKPVLSVRSLDITMPTGYKIFVTPLEWLEGANFQKGQINIIPLITALTDLGGATTGSGSVPMVNLAGARNWIAAYWEIVYTAGFNKNGLVPVVINSAIGQYAATQILGILGATNRTAGYSLGLDGVSQSVTSPGPTVYTQRMSELKAGYDTVVRKIKTKYTQRLTGGHI